MFKRSLLSRSIAASIALAGLPMLAQAQDTQGEPLLEEVVVTGIRASLDKASDIKQASFNIVDSIVAEDIGKLPDNNVVESLQRVSGVQVTDRGNGEVNAVSIRGLSDISTTVNGRTIYTSVGRSVALAHIPSTLVSQIDVSKSRSADQYENGIAGTIDVRTFRPFDFDGSRYSIAGRFVTQEEADTTDPIISALASNRWETDAGDFGALINVSYSKTRFRDQTANAGAQVPFIVNGQDLPDDPNVTDPDTGAVIDQRYGDLERIFPSRPGVAENPIWEAGLDQGLPTAAGSTLAINGDPAEYYLSRDALIINDFTGERERPGVNVSLQFAPNDDSEYYFEALYNGYRRTTDNSMYFTFVDAWWALGGIADSIEDTYELYPDSNVIKSRTVRDTGIFTSGDFTESKTDSYVYAVGGEWNLSDNFTVNSELVYQESDFEEEFFAMRGDGSQWEVTADFDDVPGISFSDNPATAGIDESDLTDPALYSMGALYDTGLKDSGSGITFTADAEYWTELDFLPRIDFGIRWDDRDASNMMRDQNSQDQNCIDRGAFDDVAECNFATYEGLQNVNSGFLQGHADVPRSWMAAKGEYLADNRQQFRSLYNIETNPAMRRTFEAEERNAAIYAKAMFETELAGLRLDGEIGGRYVDVVTDTAFYDQSTQQATLGQTETSEFLPSVSVRYHLTDQLQARLAYAETLRMPGFNDLNPTITYNGDISGVGYGTASSGNENLKPTTSKNLDLALEWYFGDASYTYVTLFQRDVEGLVIPFRSRIQANVPDINVDTFIVDRPENASDGELSGAELGLTWFPEELPEVLDGLGVIASATFLDSEQNIPVLNAAGEQIDTRVEPFFGVSDSSYSVTVAYERPKFDARLSYVWRDDALNRNEAALFANPLRIWRTAETSLDMQISYNVTDEFIVTFDATNLTEEFMQERYGNSHLHSHVNTLFSRTFALGARYSF